MSVQAVVTFLVDEGDYRLVGETVKVEDLEFRFDGVLVGPGEEGGLVLLVDGAHRLSHMLARRVSAFSRVLNRTNSRRPLAVIVINARSVEAKVISTLETVARVIRLEDIGALDLTLRRLLPFRLPKAPVQPADAADTALRARSSETPDQSLTFALTNAARTGDEAVRQLMREKVRAIAIQALEEANS